MKSIDLTALTDDQLVNRFEAIALEQDDALEADNLRRFNRLYGDMESVNNELKSRGLEARKLLMRLYDHPNLQVQVKAATKTVAIAPKEARAILERIRNSRIPPQYLDAGMLVSALDRGTWRPD